MENDLIVPFSSNQRKIDFQWSWEKGSYSVIRVVEIMKDSLSRLCQKNKKIYFWTSQELPDIWLFSSDQELYHKSIWKVVNERGYLELDLWNQRKIFIENNRIKYHFFVLFWQCFRNRDHLIFLMVQKSQNLRPYSRNIISSTKAWHFKGRMSWNHPSFTLQSQKVGRDTDIITSLMRNQLISKF